MMVEVTAGGKTRILVGDCREGLRSLPDESIHCCITSPPYFGLRDYGVEGQLGLEPTPDEFVSAMVEVFREVRRVLRDDGTLWLNLGDSYARGKVGRDDEDEESLRRRVKDYGTGRPKAGRKGANGRERSVPDGLKPKDLIGIPWRVAFALQADGWHLRQDIIWHKPNPMPESVRDRCTKAHEYIFLLSKSDRYSFNVDAIKEPVTSTKGNGKTFRGGGSYTGGASFNNSELKQRDSTGNAPNLTGKRNKRSVWTVATKPFAEAHFATFPPELIEPCVLAGSPIGGTVLDPFGGSGTTALVAQRHGRHSILCELNPEYAAMAAARIEEAGLLGPVTKAVRRAKRSAGKPGDTPLFGGRL